MLWSRIKWPFKYLNCYTLKNGSKVYCTSIQNSNVKQLTLQIHTKTLPYTLS